MNCSISLISRSRENLLRFGKLRAADNSSSLHLHNYGGPMNNVLQITYILIVDASFGLSVQNVCLGGGTKYCSFIQLGKLR